MSRLARKTVIATGAVGAPGAGMVSRFAAEGADVVIGSHREEQVTHLVDEPGRENVVFARTDVTNERRAAV